MKRFFRYVNFIFIIAAMHGENFLQAMNEELQKYAEQAQEADCYNRNHPLLLVPKELSNQIFTCCCLPLKYQLQSLALRDGMKNLMRLSLVCKKYNDLLPFKTIGDLCKSYAQEDKDNVFKELLYYAVERSDEQLVQQLFEFKADPNETWGILYNMPIFFNVKKIEVLKLFLAQENFNIHAIDRDNDGENVLWHVAVGNDYSAELIKFYLDQGVDARQCISNGSCLLHKLTYCPHHINMNEHLKKVTFFLDVIPDMINVEYYGGKTPLDCAQSTLEVYNRTNRKPVGYEKLIELYEQHGACSADEIKLSLAVMKNPNPVREQNQEVHNDEQCKCNLF